MRKVFLFFEISLSHTFTSHTPAWFAGHWLAARALHLTQHGGLSGFKSLPSSKQRNRLVCAHPALRYPETLGALLG